VDLNAKTGSGGRIELRDSTASRVGVGIFGGFGGSGRIQMRSDANTSGSGVQTVTIDAEGANLGGLITLSHLINSSTPAETVRLSADENASGNNGGFLALATNAGDTTAELRAATSTTQGSQLLLRKRNNILVGAELDAEANSAGGTSALVLYNS